MSKSKIDSTNWDKLWQAEAKRSRQKRNTAYSWDEHAEEFQRQYSRSDYRDKLLAKLQITPDMTVLDVGCGPGNLAVPLSARVKSVTALDASKEMLRLGKEDAAAQNRANITFLHLNWNETILGRDFPQHDAVICSRAFANNNPQESLTKLNDAAKSLVYLTLRTSADEATAYYRQLYREAGSEYRVFPDYIYAYNLLSQMGILPHVDYIDYTDSFRYERAENAYKVLSGHMCLETQLQREKLLQHVTRNMEKNGIFKLDLKVKWALLWWQK